MILTSVIFFCFIYKSLLEFIVFIDRIVYVVQESLAMDLLGIDVVIDSNTEHYAIIDVNPFPSESSVV